MSAASRSGNSPRSGGALGPSSKRPGPRTAGATDSRVGSVARVCRALFSDPWRKLVALGLALLLWNYLDTQITASKPLVLTLRAVDEQDAIQPIGPEDLAVQIPKAKVTMLRFSNAAVEDSSVQEVQLKFEGPKALIEELEEGSPVRVRRFPEVSAPNGPLSFQFSVDDLRLKPELQPLLKEMFPQRVRVELSRNVNHTIPLDLNTVDVDLSQVPEADRRNPLYNRARFYPDSVTLTGPEVAVAAALAKTASDGDNQGGGTNPDGRSRLFRAVMQSTQREGERFLRGYVRLNPELAQDVKLATSSTLDVRLPPKRTAFDLVGMVQLDSLALPKDQQGSYRIKLVNSAAGAEDTTVGPGESLEIPVRIEVNDYSPLFNILDVQNSAGDPEGLKAWGRRHVRLDVTLPEGQGKESATVNATLRLVLLEVTPDSDAFALAQKVPMLVEWVPPPEGG